MSKFEFSTINNSEETHFDFLQKEKKSMNTKIRKLILENNIFILLSMCAEKSGIF